MASSSKNPSMKITLRTSDEHLFDVDKNVAMEFVTVKCQDIFRRKLNANDYTNTVLPLSNVSADILFKVIAYSKNHLEFAANSAPQKEAFDDHFMKDENNETIMELIHAVNYLHVKDLYNLLTKAMADRIKNKSVEYVRELFGIENDYTPQEQKALREETAGAFEGVDEDD